MIIICNEEQIGKKKVKDIQKIIISYDLQNLKESKTLTQLKYLIPSYKLMHKYYNDEISKKKYYKKYEEFLKSEQVYATILTILLMYQKEKNLVFCCSIQEMDFLYMEFLIKFLSKEFGIKAISYDEWKKKGCPSKAPLDKDKLKKEVKKYKELIFGGVDYDEEPKKKKKDKKKSKKEEIEPKEVIRKIKIRRIKE